MRDILRGGRELPQRQSYSRLLIQNKIIPKTNLIRSDHKESEDEELTLDEKNSYASYLASVIYEYQLKSKYAGIGLLTFLTMQSFEFPNSKETTQSEIVSLKIGYAIHESLWDYSINYLEKFGLENYLFTTY